jgi:hypothetical protein
VTATVVNAANGAATYMGGRPVAAAAERPSATAGIAITDASGYQFEYTRPSGPTLPMSAGTERSPSSRRSDTASIDRSSGEMSTGRSTEV